MTPDVQGIIRLPPDVAAQIKSSTIIPSLASVVIGLIENALDAGSTKLVVEVDFARGFCVVEDDGHGIAPQDFSGAGGLGKTCYTSKYESSTSMYGKNGMFLAAVAALSILTITSHHRAHRSLSTLILHHSRAAARLIPAPHYQQLSNSSHGTRVTVQDLFGNMPVRVKQRAARFAQSEKDDGKEMEDVKRHIVGLLLGWHRPITMIVVNGNTKVRTFVVRKSNNLSVVVEDSKVEHRGYPSNQDAGFLDPTDWSSWIKTMARTSTLTVKGVISLIPAPSKDVQFVSLGIRPIFSQNHGNLLYEEINRAFASSSFGNTEDYNGLEEAQQSGDRRYKQTGFTNKQLKGGGKGVDKWPMFYIRIDFNENNEVERLDRENVLMNVIRIVRAMLFGFLRDNHFRPRAQVKRNIRPAPRPSSSPRTPFLSDPFSTWSHIKSSKAYQSTAEKAASLPVRSSSGKTVVAELQPSAAALNISDGTPPRDDPTTPNLAFENIPLERAPMPNLAEDEYLIEWTNPISKFKVFINSRTGFVVPKKASERRPSTAPASLSSQPPPIIANGMNRRFSLPSKAPVPGSWASRLLSKWENPVFATTEEPIAQAVDFKSLDFLNSHHRCDHDHNHHALAASSISFSAKLSKSGLSSARVIAQVDKKFILISMPSKESQILVLVDQHAADERVRVELLIDELYSLPPVTLAKPLILNFSVQEHALMMRNSALFAHSGITYTTATSTSPSMVSQNLALPLTTSQKALRILTLPVPIAQKCLLHPPDLLNLLRATLHDLPSSTSTAGPPPAVLSLLNSRACRSAIMFNDALSMEEAGVLVRNLASTKMPFQCAHGRPSMVPVGEVDFMGAEGASRGSASGLSRERGGETEDETDVFTDAWRRWNTR